MKGAGRIAFFYRYWEILQVRIFVETSTYLAAARAYHSPEQIGRKTCVISGIGIKSNKADNGAVDSWNWIGCGSTPAANTSLKEGIGVQSLRNLLTTNCKGNEKAVGFEALRKRGTEVVARPVVDRLEVITKNKTKNSHGKQSC